LGFTINRDPQNDQAVHEIVLTTMKGDGTPDGTKTTYADPADGQFHTITFRQFVKLCEGGVGYAIQRVLMP
jgi:hypothetical protein